jgi:hypothetical protein
VRVVAVDEAALTGAVVSLATEYGRYGYRRITALLRGGGPAGGSRLQRFRRVISGFLAFSNPQADPAKPQETCGSRRRRRMRNTRLGNRLEQQWEPDSNLHWRS